MDPQRRERLIDDPIEAVLVDAGGVLTLPDPDLVRAVLDRFGVAPSPADLARAHDHGVAASDRMRLDGPAGPKDPAAGGVDRSAFVDGFLLELGVSGDDLGEAARRLDDAFERGHTPWSKVREGATRGLKEICTTGARVAIVSNATGTVAEELARFGVCQVGTGRGASIAAVLDSTVVGVAKPDPLIFHLALNEIDTLAERTLHVGDSVHADVRGAQGAGLRAAHFDPHGICGAREHAHVGSLTEVAALVRDSR